MRQLGIRVTFEIPLDYIDKNGVKYSSTAFDRYKTIDRYKIDNKHKIDSKYELESYIYQKIPIVITDGRLYVNINGEKVKNELYGTDSVVGYTNGIKVNENCLKIEGYIFSGGTEEKVETKMEYQEIKNKNNKTVGGYFERSKVTDCEICSIGICME